MNVQKAQVEYEQNLDLVVPEGQRFRGRAVASLTTIINRVNLGLAIIAGISLVLMLLVVVINAIARVVYLPFEGTPEVVGWLAAITTSFSLGYTQLNKGNVDIDMLIKKFPRSVQQIVNSTFLLFTTVFFMLVSWHVIEYGLDLMAKGYLSETLRVAFYPFVVLTSLGYIGLTLALLLDFIKSIAGGNNDGP